MASKSDQNLEAESGGTITAGRLHSTPARTSCNTTLSKHRPPIRPLESRRCRRPLSGVACPGSTGRGQWDSRETNSLQAGARASRPDFLDDPLAPSGEPDAGPGTGRHAARRPDAPSSAATRPAGPAQLRADTYRARAGHPSDVTSGLDRTNPPDGDRGGYSCGGPLVLAGRVRGSSANRVTPGGETLAHAHAHALLSPARPCPSFPLTVLVCSARFPSVPGSVLRRTGRGAFVPRDNFLQHSREGSRGYERNQRTAGNFPRGLLPQRRVYGPGRTAPRREVARSLCRHEGVARLRYRAGGLQLPDGLRRRRDSDRTRRRLAVGVSRWRGPTFTAQKSRGAWSELVI